jgi:hypothetical protein
MMLDGKKFSACAASVAYLHGERLPRGIPFVTLRIRSVRGSLEENTRPSPNAIVSIVSASPDFLRWLPGVLVAGLILNLLRWIASLLMCWRWA